MYPEIFRIILVTGSRSDFGLVAPVVEALYAIPETDVSLFACGSHLSTQFGNTIETVRARFSKVRTWDALKLGLGPAVLADSHAALGSQVAASLYILKPQVMILTGDRTELLPIAMSATLLGVPIAHIGGGETTLGAIDEKIRTCLTALATWHFISNETFRARVLAIGAAPENVFVTGETALDTLLAQEEVGDRELNEFFGFLPDRRTLLLAFHPETLAPDFGVGACDELLHALDDFPGNIVATFPNADQGSEMFIERLTRFCAGRSGRVLKPSVGSQRWAALLRRVGALIGNSSSGLIEAPSFLLPAVNIGDRQKNRLAMANVLHAPAVSAQIKTAVQRALTDDFRASLQGLENVYGDGKAGPRIARILLDQLKNRGGPA